MRLVLIPPAFLFLAFAATATARTWYVDRAAAGGDGASWSQAAAELPAIVSAAAVGDEVWCRAGSYTLSKPLHVPSGVTLRGGFTGSETSLEQREHILTDHRTTLRQTVAGQSVADLSSVTNVTLDGLVLTGAEDAPGLRVASSTAVTVKQCLVEKNRSSKGGAGISVTGRSEATFARCKVADNTCGAPDGGAGIFVAGDASTTWNECVISGNSATGARGGGAVLQTASGVTTRFVTCDFYFNEAEATGSALDGTGTVELRDSVICSNRVRRVGSGGAIHAQGEATRVALTGKTYVVSNVAGDAGATNAPAFDGTGKCELRDDALAPAAHGPADPAIWSRRNDVHLTVRDLDLPALTVGPPGPGKWVKQQLPSRNGTEAYHCLYLPTDWRPGQKYPVLVGFPGNGPYRNAVGDRSGGLPEDNEMPYGISGGHGCIVLALGYLDSRRNLVPAQWWWGDVEATVAYCRDAVAWVCHEYGGDPARVVLTGFSRSAIGVSFIGLHDDTIARLWRAFICYDGWEAQADMARDWYKFGKNSINYDPKDFGGVGVEQRFKRVVGRPAFILGGSGEAKELNEKYRFPFTFVAKSHRNHNTSWSMRDTPEREQVRTWLAAVLNERTHPPLGR